MVRENAGTKFDSISMKDAFVFDMDGTILRLRVADEELTDLRKELKTYFTPQGIACEFKSIFKDLLEIKMQSHENEEVISNGFKIVERFEIKWAKRATPINGAKECLHLLQRKNIPISLITNNSYHCATIALHHASIDNSLFDSIITRDDTYFFKPHPEPLLKVIKEFSQKLQLKKIYFIGDHLYDVQCARETTPLLKEENPSTEIEVVSILVNRPYEYAKNAQPDLFFELIEHLRDFILKPELEGGYKV